MSGSPDLRATLHSAIAPAERLLVVGVGGIGRAAACEVATLTDLPVGEEPFDAIVWLAEAGLADALVRLRRLLRPAGLLVVWVEPSGIASQVWSALSGTPARTSVSLEQVCEALVVGGLLTPRVLGSGRHGFAVCGTMPARRDALDAFFEQPAP